MKSIAIIVTSDACKPFLIPMVRAACDKGLTVHLHFTGAGVCLVPSEDFETLLRQAHISVCRNSANVHCIATRIEFSSRQKLTDPNEMVRLIETCDRHVVI